MRNTTTKKETKMKTLLLALSLIILASTATAEPRTYENSIAEIENIDFIKSDLPGLYSHIETEWRQTTVNSELATRANKLAERNKSTIEGLNAGIAGAMAMSSLPDARAGAEMFTAGAASYDGENAIAVGVSVNPGEGKLFKFSFSTNTEGNTGTSLGFGVEF